MNKCSYCGNSYPIENKIRNMCFICRKREATYLSVIKRTKKSSKVLDDLDRLYASFHLQGLEVPTVWLIRQQKTQG